MDALEKNIRNCGMIIPIIVRKDGGVYFLRTGLNRLTALRELGFNYVKVMDEMSREIFPLLVADVVYDPKRLEKWNLEGGLIDA